MGVPRADQELAAFRQLGPDETSSSFYYHYARLIEILAAVELIEGLVNDPDVLSADFRARAKRDLRGRDLGCYCAPGLPCHADVLLELVND